MLQRFFAVTMTSVYEVRNDDGNPVVRKIIKKGEGKVDVGEHLCGGTMLAICVKLIMFVPEKYADVSPMSGFELKIGYWGGSSSAIVALFKERADAETCIESSNTRPCDDRWVVQTKEVLEAIGNEHPVFKICRSEGLALPCAL